MPKTCETCRWWIEFVDGEGPCRRYPPQITARVGQPPQIWPITTINSWCGEHLPREED